MEPFHSSQDFVRALKSSSDPPFPEGPPKIEIAKQAWDNKAFYVPRKEEVIADWVLIRLLKEKTTAPVDVRYWGLLLDVISSPQASLRTWLLPLLNRIPVLPVVVSLLRGLSDVDNQVRRHLMLLTCNCLAILWPLAVHKFTTENLLECFGIFLSSAQCCQSDRNHDQIGQWLIHSFMSSLNNSSMKKKLYSTFTQMYLCDWIAYTSPEAASSILGENIYAAGVEILFSLDILRQSVDGEIAFFDVLEGVDKPSLLGNLPRIFRSFVTTAKRFRGALFGQGSSRQSTGGVEEVRAAGMCFFVSSQPLLDASGLEARAWRAQVGLLKVIDEEALFSNSQRDFEGVFAKVVENAISVLSTTSAAEEQQNIVSLVADVLTMIARIEYSILEAALPRILPLILVTSTVDSFFSLLETLLDYHSKTRTLNTHISVILSALGRDQITPLLDDVRSAYQIATEASALVHPAHFDRLVISIRTFLTSTQILPTIRSIFETLASCSDAFSAAQETLSEHIKKVKKGKSPMVASEDIIHDLDVSAFCLTLSCRISTVILSAISQQSLPSSIREETHRSADAFRSASLCPVLSKSVRFLNKTISTHSHEVWGSSVGVSSLLRLQYSMGAQRCHSLTPEDSWESKMLTKLMVLMDESSDEHGYPIYPTMNFEIFRTLLDSVGHDIEEHASLVDKLIAFVAQGSISQDASRTQIALLHLLIDQWLPILDDLASDEQLRNLVSVIVRDGNTVLQHCLSSAQVWELPSLRNAFLAYFDEATSILRTNDQRPEDSVRNDSTTRRDIILVFRILLAFPVEYFSRQSRLNFAKKALCADTSICGSTNEDQEYISQSASVLRTFARRVFSHLGVIDRPLEDVPSYLEHLMTSGTAAITKQELTLATLDLAEFYLSSLLKEEKSHRSAAAELLSGFHLRLQLSSFLERDVRSQCFQRMLQLLIREHQADSFSDEFRADMRKIHKDFKNFLQPSMMAMIASDLTADDLKTHASGLLIGWHCIISLQRWLTPQGVNSQMYGHQLCLKFCQLDKNHTHDHAITTAFAILKEEFLYSTDGARSVLLDIVTEAYVVLYPAIGVEGQACMDAILADIYGGLSAREFTLVTKTISHSLLDGEHTMASLQCMVGVSMLLLQEIPTTTFPIAQTFTTFCITTFGSRDVFISMSPLIRQQVLRFLVQRCRDRPMTLRPVDVSAIWSLIAKLLSGAREQDKNTSTATFHDVVIVIRALVRFRRDLVVQTLPHLSYILRQLLMTMRRPRAQLGAKQSAMVAQSFPPWITPQQPLGNEEAKTLSRLLESLATKNIVKAQSSSREVQKAESLVGPFSKHAAYVLAAHINAVGDPLCVFPASLRKELEPGLFALCDMINEHSRDAIMLSSLDAGGKAMMKALWKDYEKQRYIGKG